jgi:uncharacterized protein
MTLPIYEDGIRFECQGSGRCCTSRGAYGYVYLTEKDQRRLARFLEMSKQEMKRRYCDLTQGWVHLKDPQLDCAFLEDKRCTVYEARPEQCRTWPFWPENMQAKVWREEIASFCPGIGKGRLYTKEEIEALLAR